MGKIGLITFHRAINYGAILQAYALSEAIKKMGHEPVVLDHKNQFIENVYDVNPFNSSQLREFLTKVLLYHRLRKKKKKFEDFRAGYFRLDKSADLNDKNNEKSREDYNKFITGSDQVWNFAHTQFDKAYFLDFVAEGKKKNSYAASFGFDRIPDEYLDEYRDLLADFNNISVREEQGAAIIKNLFDREAEVVLDPTLLLSRDDWIKVSRNYKGKKDYILIYAVMVSPSLLDFAVELSRQTDCEIVYISDALRKRFKADYAVGVGPQEFLGLFLNAKYVVTNSFHGTGFSINFNRAFFVELLPPPANVNSRLENIMDTFDLRRRQIINGQNDNIFAEMDFVRINQKLQRERQRSLDYLQRILDE